jgi:hypothetical protein
MVETLANILLYFNKQKIVLKDRLSKIRQSPQSFLSELYAASNKTPGVPEGDDSEPKETNIPVISSIVKMDAMTSIAFNVLAEHSMKVPGRFAASLAAELRRMNMDVSEQQVRLMFNSDVRLRPKVNPNAIIYVANYLRPEDGNISLPNGTELKVEPFTTLEQVQELGAKIQAARGGENLIHR